MSEIAVVRSFPDTDKFSLVPQDAESPIRQKLVIGYIGIIGDQDGVDMLVRAVAVLREQYGATDIVCRIIGDGPSCASVKALAKAANLGDLVEFTGYLRGRDLLTCLSSFDIGVIPDPKNTYTDNITMNKVFEYMFLAKPIVGFRLRETMDLVGTCGIFAEEETPEALAKAIFTLMSDSVLRTKMGEAGHRRARELFSWRSESQKLIAVYDGLKPANIVV